MLLTTLNKEKGAEIMTSLAQSWKEEGIQIGIKDGIKIGEARGEARGEAKLIKMMISKGQSINNIAQITGLSIEEITKLKD